MQDGSKQNKLTYFMKRIIVMLLLASLGMKAAAQNRSNGKVIKITGTRLAHPIVQRWIDEYTKLYPGIVIQINSKTPADSADIVIASYALKPGDVKEGRVGIALTRYIQLPVINTLDSVLLFAEKKHNTKLLSEHVNVIIRKNNPGEQVIGFLQWVLTKGQKYNHAYGFINLEATEIQAETKLLSSLTAIHACTNSGQLIKSRFAVK
jgi:ABC-type phosphate transport system substrate-binding protein